MNTFRCSNCGFQIQRPTQPFSCPQCGRQAVGLFRVVAFTPPQQGGWPGQPAVPQQPAMPQQPSWPQSPGGAQQAMPAQGMQPPPPGGWPGQQPPQFAGAPPQPPLNPWGQPAMPQQAGGWPGQPGMPQPPQQGAPQQVMPQQIMPQQGIPQQGGWPMQAPPQPWGQPAAAPQMPQQGAQPPTMPQAPSGGGVPAQWIGGVQQPPAGQWPQQPGAPGHGSRPAWDASAEFDAAAGHCPTGHSTTIVLARLGAALSATTVTAADPLRGCPAVADPVRGCPGQAARPRAGPHGISCSSGARGAPACGSRVGGKATRSARCAKPPTHSAGAPAPAAHAPRPAPPPDAGKRRSIARRACRGLRRPCRRFLPGLRSNLHRRPATRPTARVPRRVPRLSRQPCHDRNRKGRRPALLKLPVRPQPLPNPSRPSPHRGPKNRARRSWSGLSRKSHCRMTRRFRSATPRRSIRAGASSFSIATASSPWSKTTRSRSCSGNTLSAHAPPGPVVLGPQDTLRLHCCDGYLHCLDALTGKQVWSPAAVGEPLGYAVPVVDRDGSTIVSAPTAAWSASIPRAGCRSRSSSVPAKSSIRPRCSWMACSTSARSWATCSPSTWLVSGA